MIVCDFFHWPKMGDFRFEEEFFPDPDAMVKELKEMGMELMVSVWPQIDTQSENFAEMKQKGLLVKTEHGVEICMRFGGESVFFDPTNPAARRYVWDKCRQNYYDKGIRVFWLDEAEPEYLGYDYDNYRYYLGPDIQIGNVYPQYFSRTFYDGLKEQGEKDVVNLVRCAWAGSQRYGALVWSGDIHSDWPTFRRQVSAGLNMGIAGIHGGRQISVVFQVHDQKIHVSNSFLFVGLSGEHFALLCVCTVIVTAMTDVYFTQMAVRHSLLAVTMKFGAMVQKMK